jgi:hypothetical protein
MKYRVRVAPVGAMEDCGRMVGPSGRDTCVRVVEVVHFIHWGGFRGRNVGNTNYGRGHTNMFQGRYHPRPRPQSPRSYQGTAVPGCRPATLFLPYRPAY